ncbi:TetR/AcrR family transcriptional regulator [uncultured Agrococcus sp.]|uniref:TetR/AcrR family transcriptional regulator n=1 Tax=uncultured Agrococcus sp. TaxID=382258 RepID=UPI0025D4BFBA|nr:TetR family transcriptional regulator [uncultured Agrococcus sp.]
MAERPKVRERTRLAILHAGIDVLSNDPSAPLGEVAARADVARSTLHRYFPDRRSLAVAIGTYVNEQYDEVVDRGLQGGGTGLEQFRRLYVELTERLDLLTWWMNPGSAALCEGSEAEVEDEPDTRIVDLVARGHEDGSIDPLVSADWTENLLWSTLYAIRMTPLSGAEGFDLRNQAVRTLMKALAADPISV